VNAPTPAGAGTPCGPYQTKDEAAAAVPALAGGEPRPMPPDAAAGVLLNALAVAGVTVGEFDSEVISHFALVGSPEAVVSLCGMIARANQRGRGRVLVPGPCADEDLADLRRACGERWDVVLGWHATLTADTRVQLAAGTAAALRVAIWRHETLTSLTADYGLRYTFTADDGGWAAVPKPDPREVVRAGTPDELRTRLARVQGRREIDS
jgi:hypothetical protein